MARALFGEDGTSPRNLTVPTARGIAIDYSQSPPCCGQATEMLGSGHNRRVAQGRPALDPAPLVTGGQAVARFTRISQFLGQ